LRGDRWQMARMPTRDLLAIAVVMLPLLAGGCRITDSKRGSPPQIETSPQPRQEPRYIVYQVEEADTLYGLGEKFGIPWKRIVQENDIRDVRSLRSGQILLIPVSGTQVAAHDRPTTEPRHRSAATVRAVPKSSLHRGRPDSRFWWPTRGKLCWRYGGQVRGFSEPGIGIEAPAGTEVYSVAGGKVISCVEGRASHGAGWGNVVAVRHSDGFVSWYGLLGSITVREGQTVSKGQKIGTVGPEGAAGSAQVAFRLYHNERPDDPLRYLP